jgi:hypothetical protein
VIALKNGFLEIEEKVGLTVIQENLVEDRREKKEKNIPLVVLLWLNVLLLKKRRKVLSVLVGKMVE